MFFNILDPQLVEFVGLGPTNMKDKLCDFTFLEFSLPFCSGPPTPACPTYMGQVLHVLPGRSRNLRETGGHRDGSCQQVGVSMLLHPWGLDQGPTLGDRTTSASLNTVFPFQGE